MFKASFEGDVGQFNYLDAFNVSIVKVVSEALLITQQSVRDEIHDITHETEQSIEIEQFAVAPWVGKVYTTIPHAMVLEFALRPFMRPGARKAKRRIRELAKRVFGEEFRAQVRGQKRVGKTSAKQKALISGTGRSTGTRARDRRGRYSSGR